jgi:hypothetical protein
VKGVLKPLAAAAAFWLAFPPAGAWPVTREEVIACARSFVDLDWRCGRRNANSQYNQLQPGKSYSGVSYNWGGFDQPRDFLDKVESGKVAGNYRKRCGNRLCIRSDFAGLDCSGFVSRCWQVRRYSTTALPAIAIKIPRRMLKPGDILNSRNRHVVLFDSFDEEGQMWVYESSAWVRQKDAPPAGAVYRTVELGDAYVPRRFYRFIRIGDRVRAERAVTARERSMGGNRRTVPAKTAGTIVKGPEFKDGPPSDAAPSDVWYCIAFDNGTEGWCTLRDLILIEEAKPPSRTDPPA